MSEDLLLTKTDAEIDILIDDPNTTRNSLNENFVDFIAPSLTPSNNNNNNKMVIEHNYMLNQYGNDRDLWRISIDHCYARPWNWRPDATFLRPTKTLFVKKSQMNRKKSTNPLAPIQDYDEEIEIETINDENSSIYDKNKAKLVMEECEKHIKLAKIEDRKENWEEDVLRYNCPTATQHRLLRGILNILDSDHLGRLTCTDTNHEAIERRVVIDKSVERVRKLLATIAWESKYTQWLHQVLIDNLTSEYLICYLEILQSLKAKLPTFVDKMMTGPVSNRLLNYESLFPLLKRPWDPVASSLVQDKPKKLPGNPIILVVPSAPTTSKRMLKWINLLSNLATVITVPSNHNLNSHKTTMTNFVDQIFVMARSKLQDIRNDYQGRNIVLFGCNYGATLALQIAQVEQVLCVISLGFSLLTAEGRRGEPEDNLLELQCPVLFVIGQCANTSFQEDMEDLRERMRVETGLIVVGSADDNLRINKKLKKTEGITQSVVDRCISDEIGEFISGIILSPYPPHIRQSPTDLTTTTPPTPTTTTTQTIENGNNNGKKLKSDRKRYNSNTSSLDSEPPSPTPRITRPVGRPPGSKKAKGIPPSSPITSTTTTTTTTTNNNNTPPTLQPPSLPPVPSTSGDNGENNDNTDISPQPSPVKKLKTLKPTVTRPTDKNTKTPGKPINFQSKSLSNLLQSDNTIKSTNSGIRVLENIKLTNAINFVSSPSSSTPATTITATAIKSTLFNTIKSTSGNQFVLLPPDGKIKNLSTTTMKSTPPATPPSSGSARLITSKRQLLANEKAMKTIKKLPTNIQLATNLTTQDIMDLPIIFADDHQILDDNQILTAEQETKTNLTIPNKLVVINKPILQNSNLIISGNQKKITITPPVQQKLPPKYTKIILSTKKPDDLKIIENEQDKTNSTQILDLEKEIAASTVYKTGDIKINHESMLEGEEEDCPPGKRIKLK